MASAPGYFFQVQQRQVRSLWIRAIHPYVIVPVLLCILFAIIYAVHGFTMALNRQVEVRTALRLNDTGLREIFYESNGIRNFTISHDKFFLGPFTAQDAQLAADLVHLRKAVEVFHDGSLSTESDDLIFCHTRWASLVDPRRDSRRTDRHSDFRSSAEILAQYRRSAMAIQTNLRDRLVTSELGLRYYLVRLATVSGFALVASIVISIASEQRRRELSRERNLVGLLQTAFATRLLPLAGTAIGSSYRSATANAAVGGDFIDVRSHDRLGGYILIGDISGKGVAAAFDTAVVKFGMNSLAYTGSDPGALLTAFNTVFLRSRSNNEVLASVFFGFFDHRSGMLRYANAAHSTVYLRRGHNVEQLTTTGPLLGLEEHDVFGTREIRLREGDMLILTTDGMTEARDPHGTFLGDDGAMRWMTVADASSPQRLAEDLDERLRAYVRGPLRDDCAILVVQILALEPSQAP